MRSEGKLTQSHRGAESQGGRESVAWRNLVNESIAEGDDDSVSCRVSPSQFIILQSEFWCIDVGHGSPHHLVLAEFSEAVDEHMVGPFYPVLNIE